MGEEATASAWVVRPTTNTSFFRTLVRGSDGTLEYIPSNYFALHTPTFRILLRDLGSALRTINVVFDIPSPAVLCSNSWIFFVVLALMRIGRAIGARRGKEISGWRRISHHSGKWN